MPFDLNNAPKEKPNQFDDKPLADGIHAVEIAKIEYATSSNGNPMLRIRFKALIGGKFIFDQIMDDPTKQINLYRVSRLLSAVGVTPSGTLELKDLTKLLRVGMKLKIAIATKENFTNVDISGTNEGYYPLASPQDHGDPVGEQGVSGNMADADDDDLETELPQLQTADNDEDF